jgi:hypothetical protein
MGGRLRVMAGRMLGAIPPLEKVLEKGRGPEAVRVGIIF